MNLVLTRMPAIGPAYVSALASGLRRPPADAAIPQLEARLANVQVDADQLTRYVDICGFGGVGRLPLLFPQVLAAPLQMHLLLQKEFPLPLLGLVHIRNVITQERALRPDEPLTLSVRTGAAQQVRQGVQFEVVTEARVGEAENPIWHAVATVLRKQGTPPSGRKAAPPDAAATLSEYETFDAPADIGRRYGRISGDMNPIHLYALSARLFGFKRAIAHGMWSLARCTALLEARLGRPAMHLDAEFKRPLLLPGKVALKCAADGQGLRFALLNRKTPEVHLLGSLR